MHNVVESGRGGTHQARFERDVIEDKVQGRLAALEIGDQSLVFGRIDRDVDNDNDYYYIGRVAVWNDTHDPLVVDWRAPVSEPFYRATGPSPMGLVRRRHFASRGRDLLGIEDEYFDGDPTAPAGLKGEQTLKAVLEAGRTGRLGDIVGTIQTEQDEIIRSDLRGILVVQGGPGTGKTVVALHRAAYLLYTHRFPLAGQGVLVIGPNRLFLTYIEQVLPSLGEAGVELAVLGDLVPDVRVRNADDIPTARVKGDLRMAPTIRKAVRDRQRPLRDDFVLGVGLQRLRLTVEDSEHIIASARRRGRNHNHGRKFVVEEVYERLARSGREEVVVEDLIDQLDGTYEMREVLEWMWPVLTPAQLLHDLLGSKALLRAAGGRRLSEAEITRLYRQRSSAESVIWTREDVPLLDEAREYLGPRPKKKDQDAVRTYGHIVIDEAQDLSPMQLRMITRRSLNGSLTVVGDIAQATSAWAHDSWDAVIEHLPDRKGHRMAELTVGYRLPAQTMALAAKVLAQAVPGLKPPVAVRTDGAEPRFISAERGEVLSHIVQAIEDERVAIGSGNIAVIVATDQLQATVDYLDTRGVDFGRTYAGALEQEVSVIAVSMVKGLEIDAAIVLEPRHIVTSEPQGMRSLYVALTRATRRLTIVHTGAMPEALR